MKKRCLLWKRVIPCSTMISSLRSRVPRGKPSSIIVRRVSAVLAIRRNAQAALFIGRIQIPRSRERWFMTASVNADILHGGSVAAWSLCPLPTQEALLPCALKTRCKHQDGIVPLGTCKTREIYDGHLWQRPTNGNTWLLDRTHLRSLLARTCKGN